MVPTKLPTFAAGNTEGMRGTLEEFSDAPKTDGFMSLSKLNHEATGILEPKNA